MNKSNLIIGVLIAGIIGYFLLKPKKVVAQPAPLPAPQPSPAPPPIFADEQPKVITKEAKINWRESQFSEPYLETNLRILVNGQKVVEEFFNNTGTLDVMDGDNIAVLAFGRAFSPDQLWQSAATNYLIVKDNGTEIGRRETSVQDEDLPFIFNVIGGHVYEIVNYTSPKW